MAIITYAAIDIGSSELAMKIFEVSKEIGIVELTHLRHKLSLGAEVFATKQISYKTMSEICRVLRDFKLIMDEYRVTAYHAYGTDALREASNKLILFDQIKLQSGINVRILSNSEERFMYYKALSIKEESFGELIKANTLIADMSGGSVQLSLLSKGALVFTQNLKLGPSRIRELLHATDPEIYRYDDLINEYMDKDLDAFCFMFLQNIKIQHIIAVGTKIPEIKYHIKKGNPDFTGLLPRKEFTPSILPISMDAPQNEMARSSFLFFRKIANLTKCEDIYLSSIDLCDSIVADYAEKKVKLLSKHNFTEDILATAKNIAIRYQANMAHVEHVNYLSTEIFDSIRKLHGLGKRERLLLQISALLHSCGAFINMAQARENSYKIVMSTEIIGISHNERVMVANIVRYNSEYFPPYEEIGDEISREDYITIVKLCAILRLANVLDKSSTQKIKQVGITLEQQSLQIIARTTEDITLEKGLFHRKADVFEEAFGIRPVLKKKK